MLQRHREQDTAEQQPDIYEREQEQIKKLRAASRKIKQHLDTEPERKGTSGKRVKSNITDNESAKMKTSHGVIQGYTGVAAADSLHQVVRARRSLWARPGTWSAQARNRRDQGDLQREQPQRREETAKDQDHCRLGIPQPGYPGIPGSRRHRRLSGGHRLSRPATPGSRITRHRKRETSVKRRNGSARASLRLTAITRLAGVLPERQCG